MDVKAVKDRAEDHLECAEVIELWQFRLELTTPHTIDHIAKAYDAGPNPNDHQDEVCYQRWNGVMSRWQNPGDVYSYVWDCMQIGNYETDASGITKDSTCSKGDCAHVVHECLVEVWSVKARGKQVNQLIGVKA